MPCAQNVARRWTEFQFGHPGTGDKQVLAPAELLVDDGITTGRTGQIVLSPVVDSTNTPNRLQLPRIDGDSRESTNLKVILITHYHMLGEQECKGYDLGSQVVNIDFNSHRVFVFQ